MRHRKKQCPAKRPSVARRNNLDLERNSADAIAPAMTSSVLLPTATRWEPWSKASPADLHGGITLRNAREFLNLTFQTREENPTNLARIASLSGHLCRFAFRGGPSERSVLEEPRKLPRGNEHYSRHLVDVKRETLHIVFYPDSGRIKRVNRARLGVLAFGPASGPSRK